VLFVAAIVIYCCGLIPGATDEPKRVRVIAGLALVRLGIAFTIDVVRRPLLTRTSNAIGIPADLAWWRYVGIFNSVALVWGGGIVIIGSALAK
jgi:hypothetical protein